MVKEEAQLRAIPEMPKVVILKQAFEQHDFGRALMRHAASGSGSGSSSSTSTVRLSQNLLVDVLVPRSGGGGPSAFLLIEGLGEDLVVEEACARLLRVRAMFRDICCLVVRRGGDGADDQGSSRFEEAFLDFQCDRALSGAIPLTAAERTVATNPTGAPPTPPPTPPRLQLCATAESAARVCLIATATAAACETKWKNSLAWVGAQRHAALGFEHGVGAPLATWERICGLLRVRAPEARMLHSHFGTSLAGLAAVGFAAALSADGATAVCRGTPQNQPYLGLNYNSTTHRPSGPGR